MNIFYIRIIVMMLVSSALLPSSFSLQDITTPETTAYTLHITSCSKADERVASVKQKELIAWLDAFSHQVINKPPYNTLSAPLNDWRNHIKLGGQTYAFVFQNKSIKKSYAFLDEFVIYRESFNGLLLDEAVMVLSPEQIKWFETNIDTLKPQAHSNKTNPEVNILKPAGVVGYFSTKKNAEHIVKATPIQNENDINKLLLLSQEIYKRPVYLGEINYKLPESSNILYNLDTAYQNNASAYILVSSGTELYGIVMYDHYGEVMYKSGRRNPKSHYFKLDASFREKIINTLYEYSLNNSIGDF